MIAVKQQDQIEVFVNELGGISIKQSDSYGEEAVVVLWHTNAQAVIDALVKTARSARDIAIEAEDA